METSPEESVKNFLSLFLDDAEVERFADHNYVAQLAEEGELSWQALASVGGHASARYALPDSDPERAILRDLIQRTRTPVEALVESIAAKEGKARLDDEQARLLFHARFALGFLLLANGDSERARHILHEVAGTEVSQRGYEWRGGLSCTSDVNAVKWETAYGVSPAYVAGGNLGELAYLMIEAAACEDPEDVPTLEVLEAVPLLLDVFARACQSIDSSLEYDSPTLEWYDLFALAAEAISAYGSMVESSGDLPNDHDKQSAQYLAWQFGQLVARFCTQDRWRNRTAWLMEDWWDRLFDVIDDGSFEFLYGGKGTREAVASAISLISEYSPEHDWEKMRECWVTLWEGTYSYTDEGEPIPVSKIGPDTDLYWAMRIGFADKVLEQIATAIQPVVHDTTLTRAALEAAKTRNLVEARLLPLLEERLPPAPREIRKDVLRHMGSVQNKLPGKIVNALVKAERLYRTQVDDDDAKVWFCRAVEASLNHCFVSPLLSSIQERHLMTYDLPSSEAQGGKRPLTPRQIERLNPAQWCDVLDMSIASFDNKGLATFIAPDFKAFLNQHVGTRVKQLRSLFPAMREVWRCRGGSAHYESSEAKYEKERQELEQMRKLVLGSENSKSVIVQIMELLGKENDK